MDITPHLPATQPLAANRRHDGGFTLIEILIAIVLVGILSAVVVVGVGSLTTKGSSSACAASQDAARAGSVVHFTSIGTYPATFSAMTAATPPTLTLPSGVTLSTSNLIATGSGWTLTMAVGTNGAPPTFTCTAIP